MATGMTNEHRENERALRARAAVVIPGGMYGHMHANERVPRSYPQFWAHAEGAYSWDVDENRYIDFMCGYGPMLLGYRNPVIEAAAAQQAAMGDTITGPTARMVELAELLTATVAHADWAMFGKNGTDATSTAVRVARAATGKTKLLKATPAYHGANDWFTPNMSGVVPSDRANIDYFEYNDAASLDAAVAAHDGDIAAIMVTPFQHDSFKPQELVDPDFARHTREVATAQGAALILDEVRTAMRLDLRGAWESIGVRPDLTAYSKALANGYPIAAVAGVDALRAGASSIFVTGSFWYSGVPMAAAIATINEALRLDVPSLLAQSGERLKAGLAEQGSASGFDVTLTGPPQMPLLTFADDPELKKAFAFAEATIKRGVLMHPWHTMFMSTAHTPEIIDEALQLTADAFTEIAALDLN